MSLVGKILITCISLVIAAGLLVLAYLVWIWMTYPGELSPQEALELLEVQEQLLEEKSGSEPHLGSPSPILEGAFAYVHVVDKRGNPAESGTLLVERNYPENLAADFSTKISLTELRRMDNRIYLPLAPIDDTEIVTITAIDKSGKAGEPWTFNNREYWNYLNSCAECTFSHTFVLGGGSPK